MPLLSLVSQDGRSKAVISTYGARVLEWQGGGCERLFVPAALARDERAAPHGGIPVLHPQFGFFGPRRKHGLVRDREWEVEQLVSDTVVLRLQLHDASIGNVSYTLKLQVVLSDTALSIDFAVTNTSNEVAEFTCGLHTYLRVDDISGAVLSGLEQTQYLDALEALQLKPAEASALRAPMNVNRVYLQVPPTLNLGDESESLAITQWGFGDTVVWNPGPEQASEFDDLAGDEWRQFLCVEAAQIKPVVQLAGGASWHGGQRLGVLDR